MRNEHNIMNQLYQLCSHKGRILQMTIVAGLCLICYMLGAWSNTMHSSLSASELNCNSDAEFALHTSSEQSSSSPSQILTKTLDNVTLDFEAHHRLDADEEDPKAGNVSFDACDMKYSEYTPCQDPERSLKYSRDMLVYRERHCPSKNELMRCLIPAPPGYKNPFPWPQSRDYAWFANVPHKELTVEKAIQNWVQVKGDKFYFPGGGTMFRHGADAYIDNMNELLPLTDGSIRTALDTGCGVASWGAYLMKRNILAMSFAPRDTHEAQVQFALERGVPAMIGIMASQRIPYPARAFDMSHCSRCLIPWSQYNGMYLMEVDRVLRPGGYWVLSGPPINWKNHYKGWDRTPEDLNKEQNEIEDLARSLCWKKVAEKGDIAVWQKPLNHMNCAKSRKALNGPPICQNRTISPDFAWYQSMEECITPMPEVNEVEEIAGGAVDKWPQRLYNVPPRIASGSISGVSEQDFKENTMEWSKRMSNYKRLVGSLGQGRYRNIMDMNAYLGGFAASLSNDSVWVMNVVPAHSPIDTLPVIYERGLIGTYQDWCEAFSTYPRTYDLIHADGLVTLYKDRCEVGDILIEIDRILRPEGAVIFRDDVDALVKIKTIVDGMRWKSQLTNNEIGPLHREKILVAVKQYWTGSADSSHQTTNI